VVPELSWALVAGAGATGHVAVPELPCARRWEPQDTWPCALVLYFVLTWRLYAGYPVFRVPTGTVARSRLVAGDFSRAKRLRQVTIPTPAALSLSFLYSVLHVGRQYHDVDSFASADKAL
jgi:hypothetical protein